MPTQTKSGRRTGQRHHDDVLKKEFDKHEALRIIALLAILAFASLIIAGLFAPGLKYSLAIQPQFAVLSGHVLFLVVLLARFGRGRMVLRVTP